MFKKFNPFNDLEINNIVNKKTNKQADREGDHKCQRSVHVAPVKGCINTSVVVWLNTNDPPKENPIH